MRSDPEAARPFCYRCLKAAQMCVCAHLSPLANHTRIHVLQHALERRHPLGTARLLRLGLQRVHIDVLAQRPSSGVCTPVELPAGSGLLYPSADAQDLETLDPADAPTNLVVIDGTWSHAHRIYRDNPWIQAIPHYKLHPTAPSRYRIRREPRFECLSTLEAVVGALDVLEPQLDGLDTLLRAFETMIDDQVRATTQAMKPGRAASSVAPPPRRHRAVFHPGKRQIVVYAEPVQRVDGALSVEELLQLTAVDLTSGAVFDAVVAHVPGPDAFHCAKLGLSAAQLDEGLPLGAVLAQFRAFCGQHAELVAWHVCTLDLLVQAQVPGAEVLELKRCWANHARAKVPAISQVAAGIGGPTLLTQVRGRAGQQLAWARRVAEHLQALDRAAP